VESVEEEEEDDEIEDTGFGACGAARQPGWACESGAGEMAGEDGAAVGDRVKEGLAKIEGRVHAYGKPEAAGSAQGKTPEQASKHYARDSGPTFPRIGEMHGTKTDRREQWGQPEADALRQPELGVSAKREFLE